MAKNENKDEGMIALLPTTKDWCRIELPHLTLCYLGKITDLKSSMLNTIAKETISIAMSHGKVVLRVTGVEIFGEDEKVDVLRLFPSKELLNMRSRVEQWDRSEHSFKPHATIGPTGSPKKNVPLVLSFDRIMVAWGEKELIFDLN